MTIFNALVKPIYITTTLLVVLTSGLIFAYYRSPLYNTVENHLYDYRSRLAPQLIVPKHVVVLKMDAKPDQVPGQITDGDLSIPATLKTIDAALMAGARSVIILLMPPYEQPELAALAERAVNDPRIFLGLRNVGDSRTFTASLPDVLRPAAAQIVAADLQNYFNNRVVRSLPIIDSRNASRSHFLLPYITGIVARDAVLRQFDNNLIAHDMGDEHSLHMRLNYPHPDSIFTMAGVEQGGINLRLHNKVVIISNTDYRPTSASRPLPVYANTPWQSDGDDLKHGVPNAVILAIGLENILSGTWLRSAPASLRWSQTFLISALAVSVWFLPPSWAVFLFLLLWLLLLIGHGLLFQIFHLYIPLSDTMLFSLLATIGGSLWRMAREAHMRAEMLAQADADRDLHRLQDQFLHRFAGELTRLNTLLIQQLSLLSSYAPASTLSSQAQIKANSSAEELNDFLIGIQQFSAMSEKTTTVISVHKRPLQLRALIERILDRFESRTHELQLRIAVDVSPDILVHTDDVLLDQILFNLISNASKYSPKGGLIQINAVSKHAKVHISITDQGPGIPGDEIDKIFEKFYRIQNDQLYRAKGHGLGLYLSKYFAALLHAEIAVESAVGTGSTFTLILPEPR